VVHSGERGVHPGADQGRVVDVSEDDARGALPCDEPPRTASTADVDDVPRWTRLRKSGAPASCPSPAQPLRVRPSPRSSRLPACRG
jgi:hypothetical protein